MGRLQPPHLPPPPQRSAPRNRPQQLQPQPQLLTPYQLLHQQQPQHQREEGGAQTLVEQQHTAAAAAAIAAATPLASSPQPPRPPNPYTNFCSEQRPLLPPGLLNAQRERVLGQRWRALTVAEKAPYIVHWRANTLAHQYRTSRSSALERSGCRSVVDHGPRSNQSKWQAAQQTQQTQQQLQQAEGLTLPEAWRIEQQQQQQFFQ